MADYKQFSIRVDSIDYELYLFRENENIVEGYDKINTILPSFIRQSLRAIEGEAGRRYPYRRLLLAETPVSFFSVSREHRGGSEYIQPEMVFLPERLRGIWFDMHSFQLLRKRKEHLLLPPEEEAFLYEAKGKVRSCLIQPQQTIFLNDFKSLLFLWQKQSSTVAPNNRRITPMFHQYTAYIHYPEDPFINTVIHMFLLHLGKEDFSWRISESNDRQVIHYLSGNSLADAFKGSIPDIYFMYRLLEMKVQELAAWFEVRGVPTEELILFAKEYIYKRDFGKIDFEQFNVAFTERFGVSWHEILPAWYNRYKLPAYRIGSMRLMHVESEKDAGTFRQATHSDYRIEFSLYNDSQEDGIVTLAYTDPYLKRKTTHTYPVAAGKGIEVSERICGILQDPVLNLNLCLNYPSVLDFEYRNLPTTDTVSYIREAGKSLFLPAKGEYIVDNEDAAFKISGDKKSSAFIRWFWKDRKKPEMPVARKKFIVTPDIDTWQKYIDPTAYGDTVRSLHYRKVTHTKTKIIWQTRLEESGEYEVQVYLPSVANQHVDFLISALQSSSGVSKNTVKASFSGSSGGITASPVKGHGYYQYYRISHPEGEYDAMVEMYKNGWVSLGKFYLEAGENSIALLEEGETDQLLFGDAVKWIHQEPLSMLKD